MLKSIQSLHKFVIQATDGEIGSVDQCFFDDEKWTVRYLVVDTGGWLSGRKVLISPISVEAIDSSARTIRVSLSRKQVGESPDVDTEKPLSRQKEVQFHDYYSWPYYWSGAGVWGMSPYPGGMQGRPYHLAAVEEPHSAEFSSEEGDQHLRSTDAVRGYGIEAVDQRFGHVADFIMDDETWTIRYLVIDTLNFWPAKSVILSPSWVDTVSWSDRKFRVNLTKEQIKSCPEFISVLAIDRSYEEKLHSHYARPGYWSKVSPRDRVETGKSPEKFIF